MGRRVESDRLQTNLSQTTIVLIAAWLIIVISADATSAGIKQSSRQQDSTIIILVAGENGVSVTAGRIVIRRAESGYEQWRETDYSGRCDSA